MINQSKIILNFTEQDNSKYNITPCLLLNINIFKGRVYFTGLCGSLCISEYDPSAELLFKNNELPYFKIKNECLSLIRHYLSDESKLAEATKKYNINVWSLKDKIYMKKTKNLLMKFLKQKIKKM